MAAIADELITYLKAQAAITALVGTGTSARILQQDGLKQSSTLPAITIRQIDEQTIEHAAGRTTLRNATFEIMIFDDSPTDRNTLGGLILAALLPTNATMGATTVTEIVTLNAGQDGDYVAVDGSDTRIYWKSAAYRIWYHAT